jgi:hypothetical protein
MLELDINIVLWLNQHSQMNRIVDGFLVVVGRGRCVTQRSTSRCLWGTEVAMP